MSLSLFRKAQGKWGKRIGATIGILLVISMVLVYISPFISGF